MEAADMTTEWVRDRSALKVLIELRGMKRGDEIDVQETPGGVTLTVDPGVRVFDSYNDGTAFNPEEFPVFCVDLTVHIDHIAGWRRPT
jgi:hypothetical protein